MFGITDFPAYLLGAVAIILLPGPNSLYCLSTAAQYGKRAAAKVIAAIFIGDTILIMLTVLGATSVLHAFPNLFTALKWLGGAYLAYLGIKLLHGAWQTWQKRSMRNTAHIKEQNQPNVFQRALILSLSNPKAILFFLSFFIQFVEPNYPNPLLSFFILGLILQIISMIYLAILSWSGIKLVQWLGQRPTYATFAMGATGALFIGFAVKLATS